MRIAVIADTHLPSIIRSPDELGPQLGQLLKRADLILHAGDVTAPSVIKWCEQFATTLVARGNNDLFEHDNLKDRHVLTVCGWSIALLHQLRPESRPMRELLEEGLDGEHTDVLIAGDTHVERLEFRDGVMLLNPGSPTLPHHKNYRLGTAAVLEVSESSIHAEVCVLGQTEGSPNPGRVMRLTITKSPSGESIRADNR
jgi:uncharacterized protein